MKYQNNDDFNENNITDAGDADVDSSKEPENTNEKIGDVNLGDNSKNNAKTVKTLDDIDDPEPISDQQRIEDAFKNCPPDKCKRDNDLDKKINNYGTGIAIVMFLIAIVISIFNMKSMRFPISFLFLGLGALALAATNYLRRRNNMKCGCSVCVTQSKNMLITSILFGVLGVAGIVTVIVLTAI